MEKNDIIRQLAGIPGWQLGVLMERLAQARIPFPERQRFQQSRYFLGVKPRAEVGEDGERKEVWWHEWEDEIEGEEWVFVVVANPDRDVYPEGVRMRLAWSGGCDNCPLELFSSAKNVVCPICGERTNLSF